MTGLFRIKDEATRSALKTLADQIALLQGATGAAAWRGEVNAGGHALGNLAPGSAETDAVTVAQLTEATDPRRFARELSAAGVAPLNVTSLPGAASTVILYGTDATMRVTAPSAYADGTIFYQTDRKAFYQSQSVGGTPTWVLLMSRPDRDGSLYAGLGTNDAGIAAFLSTEGYTARWSGSNWNYYLGSLVDTFANRPGLALADRGFLFFASDYGYHAWRKMSTPNDWLLIEGLGGPMYGTAANRATVAATLGANDTGFYHVATDQGRQLWRWSGSAFVLQEGFGGPMRDTFANRPAALGANDAGFWFQATNRNDTTWRWSGTAWILVEGYGGPHRDTFANRPTAGGMTAGDAGYRFIATDQDEIEYRWSGSAWNVEEGHGGPFRVAWASLPALAAGDVGFKAQITDRGDHLYRWSGTAWVLQIGFGGPMQGTVVSADQRPALGANDVGFVFYGTDNRLRYRWDGAAWVLIGAYDGTYTPTLTNVTNVSASTAYECQYLRAGNTVTVSGKVDIDITAAVSSTELGISLPIASNFGAEEDCGGTAVCPDSSGLCAAIRGDAANNRAALVYVANTDDGDLSFFFTFTYQILA